MRKSDSTKPYAVIGAEQLTSSLYKSGNELIGFLYRFNIVRLDSRMGHVSHWLGPRDLLALLKLIRVLAAELEQDGCIDANLRRQLRQIGDSLDETLHDISTSNLVQRKDKA